MSAYNPLTLAALRNEAEKVCRYAVRKRKTIGGAVNWADLFPVTVEHYEALSGDEITEGYRVWIEEASPDAYELRQFVADQLAKHGFAGVEVRTEW